MDAGPRPLTKVAQATLAAQRADIEARLAWERALLRSAQYGRAQRVAELLEGKPASQIIDYENLADALKTGATHGQLDVVKVLLDAARDGYVPIADSELSDRERFRRAFGVDPQASALKEALEWAVDLGYRDVASLLTDALAPLEAQPGPCAAPASHRKPACG